MVKNKDMQFFYREFENEKKKGQHFFDLHERGFEPQIFSSFPAHDFEFSWKVRETRSNQNKLLKDIGLYESCFPQFFHLYLHNICQDFFSCSKLVTS